MAKNNHSFSHDFGARNDPKLQCMLMEMGYEGLGIYWALVEILYEQGGYISARHLRSIAFTMHLEEEKLGSVLNDFELFESDGECYWSPTILTRVQEREDLAQRRKDASRKAVAARWEEPKDATRNAIRNALRNTTRNTTRNATRMRNALGIEGQADTSADVKHSIINKNKDKDILNNNIFLFSEDGNLRKKILRAFAIERNFIDPHGELTRFVDYYEANGWCRTGSTTPVKDPLKLAKGWKPQLTGKRWPEAVRDWVERVDAYGVEYGEPIAWFVDAVEKIEPTSPSEYNVFAKSRELGLKIHNAMMVEAPKGITVILKIPKS